MAVDETSLERIRKATFPASRRGYDKREVDKFLNRLADWLETGGGDQTRSDTVRRELERVGERTGAILAEAEDSAQQIRAEAEQEAEQLREEVAAESEQKRSEADAYSAETRAAADSYAKETRATADQDAADTRSQADEDAAQAIADAEAKAQRMIDEGTSRRTEIEAVIGSLASRRDDAIGRLEGLSSSLQSSIDEHKPGADDDPFVMPEELDPAARGDAAAETEPQADPDLEPADLNGGDPVEHPGDFQDFEAELEDEMESDLEEDEPAEAEATEEPTDGEGQAELEMDTEEAPQPKTRGRRTISKSSD
jgi:DivIVA domain-containing protein